MAAQSDLRFTFSGGSDDTFDVVEFRLTEGLSETFRLDIDLSCTNPAVDFADILDRPALCQNLFLPVLAGKRICPIPTTCLL